MRIITLNIPEPQLKKIDTLCGENQLYPSRSEFFRVGLKSFLKRYLASHTLHIPVQPQKLDVSTARVKCQALPPTPDGKHFLDISGINALIESNKL